MSGQQDSASESTVHLSVDQAAEHAGVSTKTIRRMIGRGQLGTGRVGQTYVIELSELERAMRERELSRDSRTVQSTGHGQLAESMLANRDALRELMREAVRAELAPLLVELDSLRVQRDQLSARVRMLEAPQEEAQPRVAWWRRRLFAW